MTRIVAGSRGGRQLATPPGRDTRPTGDRVREALFSSLGSLVELAGCRFADLYAGSGAVGLEAASRGAEHVLLVESDPRAARVIRANTTALGLDQVCHLAVSTVAIALGRVADAPYDVVFADPPYGLGEEELVGVLTALVDNDWLALSGVVVVERSRRSPEPIWPDAVTAERGRRYGEATLWYGRRANAR